MELCLDTSKTYAIALQGGGAKGGYEIGVWQALDEAGVKYNAVSGTSVGALNGAMMAMRDLPRAVEVWSDIRLSKVIDLGNEENENDFKKLVDGKIDPEDWQAMIPQAMDFIRNRGLDVAPLRAWVHEVVDVKKLRESDVDLYVSTVSLTDRKALEVHVNELPDDQICDMLLASAYHPTFRLEKLGGKFYTDGGFVDSIPLHALVEHGYRDIIAVRIHGMGWERRFRIPEDVSITTIRSYADLGHVLNFEAEQAKRDMAIGYLDAKRVLYGLYGRHYYIERSMSEREAIEWILDRYGGVAESLREVCERELPRMARQRDVEDGDYYELMVALLEQEAETQGVPNLRICQDRELIEAVETAPAI